MTNREDWVAFVAPGRIPIGWLKAALMTEHIIDVRESQALKGETAMILVNASVLSQIDNPPPLELLSNPQRWPDGEPVTPWADPWHDVTGDIRAIREGDSDDM